MLNSLLLNPFCTTHQVQDGVDHLPVRHLANFDESDENGELEVIRHRHPDNLLRPLNFIVGRTTHQLQLLRRGHDDDLALNYPLNIVVSLGGGSLILTLTSTLNHVGQTDRQSTGRGSNKLQHRSINNYLSQELFQPAPHGAPALPMRRVSHTHTHTHTFTLYSYFISYYFIPI